MDELGNSKTNPARNQNPGRARWNQRAATAASILAHHGNHTVSIVTGGPEDWAAATNQTLDIGP